jgi:hypothetical protein
MLVYILKEHEMKERTVPDHHGNKLAQEGYDRCECGCKYWEHDECIDCGTHVPQEPAAS